MAISIVNVVVPLSGDGPIANIANLVGEKTVELSGRFNGRYILLGSHNGVNFVPVLSFDSNGEEVIKLTLKLALVAVRVRAEASSPVGVTMNVSGVLGAGSNFFATVGALPPGASGLQPPIDLGTLFPPSGLEADINFLCQGGFEGLITVKGSMDGSHFSPIDGFRADDSPITQSGTPPILEFSPLVAQQLVRYIQLDISGIIQSTTTITVGGSQGTGGGGASTVNVGVVTTTDTMYALQAKTTAVLPYVDSTGNSVVGLGPSIPQDTICIGQRNIITYTGLPIIAIGSDIASYLNDSIVIGQRLSVNEYGSDDIVIGQDIACHPLQGNSHTEIVAVGHNITVGGTWTSQNILIGRGLIISQLNADSGSAYNLMIGGGLTMGTGAFGNNIIAGESSNGNWTLENSQYNNSLGNNYFGSHVNYCSSVGNSVRISDGSYEVTLIGASVGSSAGASHVYAFGDNIFIGDPVDPPFPTSQVLALGTSLNCSSVGAETPSSVVLLGHNSSLNGPFTADTVLIGTKNNITGILNSVIIGTGITFSSLGTSSNVIIGDSITFGNGSLGLSVIIGGRIIVDADGEGIAIGYAAHIGAGSVGTAIGVAAELDNTSSQYTSIAIGQHALATDRECIIGDNRVLNAAPSAAMNHFAVRGITGLFTPGAQAIDTLSAIAEPIADYTGLTVTYNDGAAISNKTIQAGIVGSLPVGAKVLFIV